MTSRFGKTYSRKGGEANSKFDEVFSNKKPTLSTKWGETTYKAQLGSKRPTLKEEAVDLPKRPRIEDDDSSEDPFGFDSDEESRPVTSHCVPQTKPEEADATKAPLVQGSGRSTATSTAPVHGSGDASTTSTVKLEENSLSPYKNTPESSHQRPTSAQPAVSKELSSDDWNSTWTEAGSRSPSSSADADVTRVSGGGDSQDGLSSDGVKEETIPVETIPPSPFLLRPANCKKYQRSSKASDAGSGDNKPVADGGSSVPKPGAESAAGGSVAAASSVAAKPAGRGRGVRVRDYTVLHPSCVSVCNVTIQDSIERSVDELSTAAPPADLGEAGQMKKKTDTPPPKHSRYRPTQSKTKKETKLEFFGFEDKECQEGAEGGADSSAWGSSSYKIKYFGFDDVSESDSDEDDDSPAAEKRKAKKKAAAAALAAMAAASANANSPQPSDAQDTQSSSNTDILEFSDDSGPGGSEGPAGRSGKQGDKSKEVGRKIFSGPKKVGKSPAKASYNARHWNQPDSEDMPPPPLARAHTAPPSLSSTNKDSNTKSHNKDDGLFKAPPPPPKVIKSVTIPTQPYQDIVTALKCRKEHKELYTVVQHVKHFNDVVEFGENQEFTDDFEYLETGLKSSQPLNTRCLSIISLATRCAMPGFRMHLRARGKVAQVFNMLSDAPQHPNLALCTAALMYILSRDRLNMDLDRASLELMLRLLELEHDHSARQDQLTAKEVAKVKEKIRKLCETVHNKHLDLENITSGHLAMETLLSLTSKRAGDWFKEELRLLGGLDHIVDKVKECVQSLSEEEDKEHLVASLWGAERCLRVLESVTVQNPENQGYLIAYKDSQLIVSSARGLRYCEDMIQRYSREANTSLSSSGTALPHCSFSNVGKAVEDCMRAVIGVLLNLTHDNEWGSTKTGEQDQLIVTALNCVLRVPRYLPQEQRFDIRVLGLGLLINLVEYSARNRHCLVDMEYTCSGCPEDSLVQPKPEDSLVQPGDSLVRPEDSVVKPEPEDSLVQPEDSLVQSVSEETQAPEPAAASTEAQSQGTEEEEAKGPPSGALAALVQFFLERERAAILAEAQTDDLISEAPKAQHDQSGEWQETSGEIQWVASENNDSNENDKEKEKKEEEEEELDLNKALQHAGKHMEDSIVASYTALLLGCLCQGSQVNVTTVRDNLPKGDFSIMTEMLKKFLNFMNLTCAMGTTGQKSMSRVIDYLEHC